MPLAAAPKSSTAMSAATLDPGPARAAYGPDSSLRTPILTIPPEIWAWACSPARPSTAKSVRTLAAQPAETRMFSRALLTPRDHRGASRIAAATAHESDTEAPRHYAGAEILSSGVTTRVGSRQEGADEAPT